MHFSVQDNNQLLHIVLTGETACIEIHTTAQNIYYYAWNVKTRLLEIYKIDPSIKST